jgi:hypothetical protein
MFLDFSHSSTTKSQSFWRIFSKANKCKTLPFFKVFFYSIFSIQRWSIYIQCCRFHPFRSFFSSCYFTSRMWFQVMLHYKKVFLCLLKMDCMIIKSIGFVINGRWIYNYLCNKCTDVVSSNLDQVDTICQ